MQTKNKLEDQLSILSMLYTLLVIGFPLATALEIMSVKFETSQWTKQLEAGCTFYQVLSEEKYDKDVLLIIKLGLDSESFELTIKKAMDIITSKIVKKNELIELVKYPIMLVVIAILSLAFVSFFLLPQFEKILNSMGAQSKATTLLYDFFNYAPYVIVILLICCTVFAIVFWRFSYETKLRWLIKFKPIRHLYVSLYNQVFVVTLSNLLKTKLHLSVVIDVLVNQDENILLAKEATKIKTGLSKGEYIADSITEVYYDKQLLHILKLGEESGMLIYYLDSYSKIISAINQQRGKKIIFWIQPIFYLTFGVLILLLYAAIFIPMFSLMDSI